jgi:RND family efflux transporter MFP subunit
MKKPVLALGVALVLALAVFITVEWGVWQTDGAAAQSVSNGGKRGQQSAIPVDVAVAVKKTVPVRIELLGTVTPIASVAVKPRVDSTIVAVHFHDGAMVQKGDPLFTLDSRTIQAQIKQIEGVLSGAKAQLAQAKRDVERYTELAARNVTTLVTLNNAKTQVNVFGAAVDSNTAQLEMLRVQLDYTNIRAPITGHVSMAAVKVGNFVRQADTAPLATIIQTKPVYVTFALPQENLPELRSALAAKTAHIEAVIPGEERRAKGQVTMIENTVDPATGTVPVRATMPNADELLWPGTLVKVQLTFREEEAVTVPGVAVEASQKGNYVFVVKDGVAKVRPVKVSRVLDGLSVLESGLREGETVVTEGQLRLTDGARVTPRQAKPGA